MAIDKMYDIVGKVVTSTGNKLVGYGVAGNPILGVVETIEGAGTAITELQIDTTKTNTTFALDDATKTALGLEVEDIYFVGVNHFGCVLVPISNTGAKKPVAGGFAMMSANGVIEKVDPAATPTQPQMVMVLEVDTTNNTAVIKL